MLYEDASWLLEADHCSCVYTKVIFHVCILQLPNGLLLQYVAEVMMNLEGIQFCQEGVRS